MSNMYEKQVLSPKWHKGVKAIIYNYFPSPGMYEAHVCTIYFTIYKVLLSIEKHLYSSKTDVLKQFPKNDRF